MPFFPASHFRLPAFSLVRAEGFVRESALSFHQSDASLMHRVQPPKPGDYYGLIYKGSLVLPVLLLVLIGVAIGLLIRWKRK